MFSKRSTLAASLLALALTAACTREAADGITGPSAGPARSPSGSASPGAAANRSVPAPPPAPAAAPATGGIIGWDLARDPISYLDASGRLFEVTFAVDAAGDIASVQHSIDGVPFATTAGDAKTSNVLVTLLTNGQAGYEQLVSLGAPAGARHGEERADARPRQRPPERAMALIPCIDEWAAYAAAAVAVAIAYRAFRMRPTFGTGATLSAAVGAFVRSWLALYDCMEDYYAMTH